MPQSITEEEMLDLAARIAVQARLDKVDRSQIENLLASVEIASDPKNSPWIVALHAYKQAGRGEKIMGSKTASLIYEAMRRLSETGGNKEDARKLLGLVKWIYESFGREEKEESEAKELGKKKGKGISERLKEELKKDAKDLKFQEVLEILKRWHACQTTKTSTSLTR